MSEALDAVQAVRCAAVQAARLPPPKQVANRVLDRAAWCIVDANAKSLLYAGAAVGQGPRVDALASFGNW